MNIDIGDIYIDDHYDLRYIFYISLDDDYHYELVGVENDICSTHKTNKSNMAFVASHKLIKQSATKQDFIDIIKNIKETYIFK